MPYKHDDKSSGQLIRSADWNVMGHEIERLEADKVNRAGDTIKGDLTVTGKAQLGPLTVTGDASLSGKAQLGSLAVSGKAQLGSLAVTGDASVAGLLLGAKSSYWGHNPYADAIGPPVASVGRLEVGGFDDGSGKVPAVLRIHQWGSGSAEFYKPQGQTLYLRETPGGGGGWFNTLEVNGAIRAGNSDLYFSKTDHDHTGIGNTDGWAAIENARNFDALMILGRAHTGGRRVVKLWDYLEVNGELRVTGPQNIVKVATFTKAVLTGGAGKVGTWTINYSGFSEVYAAFAVLQGYSLWNNQDNINFNNFGYTPQLGGWTQHVYVKVDSYNNTSANGHIFCQEATQGWEPDNTVLFTLVVIGRG